MLKDIFFKKFNHYPIRPKFDEENISGIFKWYKSYSNTHYYQYVSVFYLINDRNEGERLVYKYENE